MSVWAPYGLERAVGAVVSKVLGMVLLAAVVVALLVPREPNIPYDHVWVWVGFGAFAGLWLTLVAGRRRLAASRPLRWLARRAGWVSWFLTLLGTAACLVVALNLVYPVGWDAKAMSNLGSRLAQGPAPLFYYRYLSRYPNQIPFAAISRMSWELKGLLGWDQRTVFALVNAACVGVSLQSLYVVVRRVRSAPSGLVAQVAGIALVALSPWVTVPYTDIVTLPWPILATALALTAATRSSRVAGVALGVAAVAALAVGFVLKTTPVATMAGVLALGVVVVASLLRRPRRAAAAGAVVLVAAGVFLGASAGADAALSRASGLDLTRVDTSRTPPLSWWVAMGMTSTQGNTKRYGAYNATMVARTVHLDHTELVRWSDQALRQRLHELGPTGYATFAANKVTWNLGDGMFWAWGEGSDATTPVPRHGPLTPWIVSWSHPQGTHYALRAGLTQGLWLVVLLAAGLGLLVRPYRRDVALVVASVFAIILFTLVFQGRSRYLLVYSPVFVALAAAVAPGGRNGLVQPARLALSRVRSRSAGRPRL
ncbi:hypothetical protein ASG70_12245 [Phycicoccus sp. Soil748]|nr:hypothetical protein ASG70_12245 [Phycicoccus sp. Soil748]